MFRLVLKRSFSSTAPQDVVIIGGGPGGYVAAIKAAQLGLKATCVEMRGSLGGTCLNIGCIPSKALLHATHLYHEAQHEFKKFGINGGDGCSVDLDVLHAHKDKIVKGLTGGIESLFKKNKVTYEKGKGVITGKNEVTVEGLNGEKKVISTKNIIIATGSDAIELPFLKFDERRVVSSTGALALSSVPRRMALVGGGVIGLEMGSVWSRLGAEVTVIEALDQISYPADRAVAAEFQKALKKQGLKFQMKRKVKSAEETSDGALRLTTVAAADDGDAQTLEADVVLVSVGRRPFTAGLGLEAMGIQTDKAGRVITNNRWQTNIDNIYAIGDVKDGPMLAHKAEEEGIAAVEEIVAPGTGHVNFNAIPSVIYTNPEVAWVGETEEQLKARGVEYNVGTFPMAAQSRARSMGYSGGGFFKVIADKATDRLLGAHIVAPGAGDLIQEFCVGMEYGAAAEHIAVVSHAHPTLSEGCKEASMAASKAIGKSIHF